MRSLDEGLDWFAPRVGAKKYERLPGSPPKKPYGLAGRADNPMSDATLYKRQQARIRRFREKRKKSGWDESKHPRVPAGSGDPSGEFTSGGGGGDVAQRAREKFGVTNDPKSAGFILSNGDMLNFGLSGTKHDQEHKAIHSTLSEEDQKKFYGHDAVYHFTHLTGAVRMVYTGRGNLSISFTRPPSQRQLDRLAGIPAPEIHWDAIDPVTKHVFASGGVERADLDHLERQIRRAFNRPKLAAGWNPALHPRGKTTPESRGGSFAPKGISAEAYRTVEEYEKKIINQAIEYGLAVDADGNLVLAKHGARSSINFDPDEMARLRGTVFTHNHPNGGLLSPDDLGFACNARLLEVRAIGSNGRLTTMRPRRRWPLKAVMMASLATHHQEVTRELGENIRRGYMTPDDAGEIFWDQIYKRVASDWNLEYTHVKPKKVLSQMPERPDGGWLLDESGLDTPDFEQFKINKAGDVRPWDESRVHRGKTTPGTTPGSFAPKDIEEAKRPVQPHEEHTRKGEVSEARKRELDRAEFISRDEDEARYQINQLTEQVAADVDWQGEIHIVDIAPDQRVDEHPSTLLGFYDNRTDHMEVFVVNNMGQSVKQLRGVLAHEMHHAKFEFVFPRPGSYVQINQLPDNPFEGDDMLRTIVEDAGGMRAIEDHVRLAQDGRGLSDYSVGFWSLYHQHKRAFPEQYPPGEEVLGLYGRKAVNEAMSEIQRELIRQDKTIDQLLPDLDTPLRVIWDHVQDTWREAGQ